MKVLLVDDEEDLRKILARALVRRCGVEIIEAQGARQAIELLKSEAGIELVISDYHMPEGTGGELFKYLVSVGSRLPFVLHSSFAAESFPEFKGHKIAGSALKPDSLTYL